MGSRCSNGCNRVMSERNPNRDHNRCCGCNRDRNHDRDRNRNLGNRDRNRGCIKCTVEIVDRQRKC